jgi:hypothetical protein
MARYAEGTSVTVAQSRGDITGILTTHGVETMAWGANPKGDYLAFELGGHSFRLDIVKPTIDDVFRLFPNHRDTDAKLQGEWRRRWRATVLLLKAKLEFADGETSTIDQELMPYLLLRDGTTLGQAVLGDKIPLMLTARGK